MNRSILISLLFIGMLISVFCIAVSLGFLAYYFFTFGSIPSGGPLSDNQSRFDVQFYDIRLAINPENKTISGSTAVYYKSLYDGLSELELDLVDDLEVTEVQNSGGQSLEFKREPYKLYIHLLSPLRKQATSWVTVYYHGEPTQAVLPPWRGGFNWSKDDRGDHWIGVSCQGEGAKVWFPCKDHPSDEPDSAALHITVPKGYYCASNGLLQGIDTTGALSTFHWLTRYPINNYNINISIARYAILQRPYITLSRDTMPVVFYYIPREGARPDCLIDMAVDMLYTYRKYYGEYPFAKEKFGLAENDYLGMEHQTLNAYGNGYRFETLNGHTFDQLMLHEMGHEWWGNKVTAGDWADFWIHEGICTYGEGLYHREKTGEAGYHRYMATVRKRIGNRNPLVPKRNATTSESYNNDIYFKGAYLMHSLRFLTGDSIFFPFLKSLAENPRYTYTHFINTDDFIAEINRASGKNLKPFMDVFLYTTDYPVIEVVRRGDNQYALRLTRPDFELPVEIRTSAGVERVLLSGKPVILISSDEPVVDPNGWYLLTVINKNASS